MLIQPLPAFNDNYLWLAHDGKNAVVVDPGDAQPVLAALQAQQLTLQAISDYQTAAYRFSHGLMRTAR